MATQVTICIGNRFTWGGIELTIESILKRTTYPSYKILVVDNSQAPYNVKSQPPRDLTGCDDDGSRIEYLREQARRENIQLVERTEVACEYGHGENINIGLNYCRSPYAMLLSAGNEIVDPDWIQGLLIRMRTTNRNLGVSPVTMAANHFEACWIAPRYIPNWMLLNMEIYRGWRGVDDFSLKRVSLPEYKYKHIFNGLPPLQKPHADPPRVFLDTGWRLYERLRLEANPDKLTINVLRPIERRGMFNFLGGLDRNAHRPLHKHVIQTRPKIEERLKILRGEILND